ncbi:MAG TPA: NapC/NirT family cytochrome c [Bryobacteraceae bacterium]|nr:NapC/NirT family cytochrome c [Bryobacteraceae bacterium]
MLGRTPLAYLASNLISLIGVVLVTTSGILWLLTLPAFWKGEAGSPYIGILLFLILPGVFLLGLILIPAGIALHTWKRRRAGDRGPFVPQGGELRKLAMFVVLTTMANLVMGSQFSYRAVTYMDTDTFCGQACHTVMNPEFTAYRNSPHARVACTDCHIGPGASFFVKSKLSGAGQVLAVLFDTYPRPIPSPVEQLRPARETCEQCHWPQKFDGDKFFIDTEYASDEQNTASTTVALMKIGGRNFSGTTGIHGAHVGARARMDYVATDGHRQVIPQVTYTDPNGKVTVYKSTDVKVTPEELVRGEQREMDCMDCHNRPTHIFQLPERALDLAMTQGSISPKLPFIKKQALQALKREYPDHASAARQIEASLDDFYRTTYPQLYAGQQVALKDAIGAVQTIYAQNVFPGMKISWGTYPNNLGHTDFPGCFRCHDGNHTSADGRTITNDCATCHDLLAVGEKNPKILTELGMDPSPRGSTGGAKDK